MKRILIILGIVMLSVGCTTVKIIEERTIDGVVIKTETRTSNSVSSTTKSTEKYQTVEKKNKEHKRFR